MSWTAAEHGRGQLGVLGRHVGERTVQLDVAHPRAARCARDAPAASPGRRSRRRCSSCGRSRRSRPKFSRSAKAGMGADGDAVLPGDLQRSSASSHRRRHDRRRRSRRSTRCFEQRGVGADAFADIGIEIDRGHRVFPPFWDFVTITAARQRNRLEPDFGARPHLGEATDSSASDAWRCADSRRSAGDRASARSACRRPRICMSPGTTLSDTSDRCWACPKTRPRSSSRTPIRSSRCETKKEEDTKSRRSRASNRSAWSPQTKRNGAVPASGAGIGAVSGPATMASVSPARSGPAVEAAETGDGVGGAAAEDFRHVDVTVKAHVAVKADAGRRDGRPCHPFLSSTRSGQTSRSPLTLR